MAVTAFLRFKWFWGVDTELGPDNVYTEAQQTHLGVSAAAGDGVGARRAQLVMTRTPPGTFAEDVMVMHFDFLNFTGGAPDDTWITADFTTLETAIGVWFNAIKTFIGGGVTLTQIRWYRFGSGVSPPNPPVRVTAMTNTSSGTGQLLPPQCASAISFHVGPRRSWGRTYLPPTTSTQLTTGGILATGYVDGIVTATQTLVTTGATNDFQLVVYSATHGALYQVEQVAMDNVVDIIRRRRWEHPTYRKALP